MPFSDRSRSAGGRSRQHYGGSPGRCAGRLNRSGLALLLCISAATPPLPAQNLLQIRVLEGEGAIHGAGAKASRPVIIEITDETGKPVDGAAVSFRMPEEGPGASFRDNMRTDIRITTPDGRAAIYEFVANTLPGPFQIRVTAVKSQVRAGIVVSQYVSDKPVKQAPSAAGARSGAGSSRKWLWIALAAGGGGAAAVLGGGMGKTGTAAPATSAALTQPPMIGAPAITVGGGQ